MIVKHSGIVEFFRSLISTLNSMNVERDHRALLVNQRVPTTAYAPDSAEQAYLTHLTHLTPYAFRFVKVQLDRASRVQIEEDGGDAVVVSDGVRLATTP